MVPNLLVDEITVRGPGESPILHIGDLAGQNVLLRLGITHAVEQESIDVHIYVSQDGVTWPARPVTSFTQKFYCGTYQMILPACEARFLKATWRVSRWGCQERPFFRFYIDVQPARVRAMAGAA